MSSLTLAWIPALPLAGFLILALGSGRLGPRAVAWIGAGSIAASALLALRVAAGAWGPLREGEAVGAQLWTWWSAGGLAPAIALRFDSLAAVFVFVVTGVGFLIHLYATEYMRGDEGYARFFAWMNLFVASMLVLVLADNLLLLYLGWEGVGLCSYLLIGFWYRDPANGRAARKAFIVTRVGDTAFALGIFLVFWELGTVDIQTLLGRAASAWPVGSGVATAAALLFLGGAIGKSAQLPLHTWLPDAMAGPTPVSALIHAATMVTAGVYLIARLHTLFALSPAALAVTAAIGAVTLLVAGLSALAQTDIKRVLAWSTVSQIGYMFLALGVAAWQAAVFHFMTHAFFKALLFMGAGAVILALHHEQDLRRMGGLARKLPLVALTFTAGAASLAALPFVTAGFFSKESILAAAWASPHAGRWLWAAGVAGAFVTALYSFRLVFRVFAGPLRTPVTRKTGWAIAVPLVGLAVLAVAGGFIEFPAAFGGPPRFSSFLAGSFPDRLAGIAGPGHGHAAGESVWPAVAASLVVLGGLLLAWVLYAARPALAERWSRRGAGAALARLLLAGWGFDRAYDLLWVRPFAWLARITRPDYFDSAWSGLAAFATGLHLSLARTQSGRLRAYAMGIALGAVVGVAILLWS